MSPVRLAPNTVVADSAVTASTVPSRALPTGTGGRPRPRSSAYRTPMSTLGGAPAAATARTTDRARPPGGGSGSGRAGRACRTAGQTDSSSTAATTAGAPISVTSGSTDTAPGIGGGQPRLPHRGQRGQRRGQGHRPGRAGHPDDERPGQAEQHELAASQPHRGQRVVIVDVGAELPGRGLPQDRQPGQRDQPGQYPPAHRLRA